MNIIAGVDEVGRGCLAGPLVAAAVVLDRRINLLKDSKLIAKKQRELLSERIKEKCASFGIGWTSPAEIDELGLTKATALAMERAMSQITCDYDEVIVDGSINYLRSNPKSVAIIKADQTVKAVSAASILAKVARDNYMSEQSVMFPDYGFDKHVGYGTKIHLEKLKLKGPCEIHRRSFAPVHNFTAVTMDL